MLKVKPEVLLNTEIGPFFPSLVFSCCNFSTFIFSHLFYGAVSFRAASTASLLPLWNPVSMSSPLNYPVYFHFKIISWSTQYVCQLAVDLETPWEVNYCTKWYTGKIGRLVKLVDIFFIKDTTWNSNFTKRMTTRCFKPQSVGVVHLPRRSWVSRNIATW